VTAVLLPELRWRRCWALGGVGLLVLIAYMCLVPGDDVPDVQISDKLVHFLMFLIPAFWIGSTIDRRHLLLAGAGLLIYGALLELAQSWLNWGRAAEWMDFLADAIGVVAGLALALTPLGRWAHWLESLSRKPT
jgi:VanZ family protein